MFFWIFALLNQILNGSVNKNEWNFHFSFIHGMHNLIVVIWFCSEAFLGGGGEGWHLKQLLQT